MHGMNISPTPLPNSAQQVADEASQWWVTLHEPGCTASDRRAFAEWVARSPERVEAYLRFSAHTNAIGKVRWPQTSEEELIREVRASTAAVTEMPRPDRSRDAVQSQHAVPRALSRGVKFSMAAAVVAVLAGAVVFFGLLRTQSPHYQTTLGEQRSVVLEDGSIVELNTSSSIEVELAPQRRVVRLLRGEALFHVAADKHRPFDVLAGNATIRAVGTQFNVDRRSAKTTVTVLEGKVTVDTTGPEAGSVVAPVSTHNQISKAARALPAKPPVALAAGDQAVVESGEVARTSLPNPSVTTAWTQRQLIFEHRPLGEVTEEFNRYNRVQIFIEDAALREEKITGVFEANDPQSFLGFLEGIPDVRIESSDTGSQRTIRLRKIIH